MIKNKRFLLLIVGITFIFVVATLVYSSVDNSLSEEDKQYIPKYLSYVEYLPEKPTYKDELNFIISVQRSVLMIAPTNDGLPFGQKREPRELYEARTGLCFDRSRVIEKILRYAGFETRHVSIYSTKKTGSAFLSLISPGVSSHAVTEVWTQNGWLIVDSNEFFVSIDKDAQPVSIEVIQHAAGDAIPIKWNQNPQTEIYAQPFTFVYGLYSRHGQFYPPYNFIPDINYREFIQTLL